MGVGGRRRRRQRRRKKGVEQARKANGRCDSDPEQDKTLPAIWTQRRRGWRRQATQRQHPRRREAPSGRPFSWYRDPRNEGRSHEARKSDGNAAKEGRRSAQTNGDPSGDHSRNEELAQGKEGSKEDRKTPPDRIESNSRHPSLAPMPRTAPRRSVSVSTVFDGHHSNHQLVKRAEPNRTDEETGRPLPTPTPCAETKSFVDKSDSRAFDATTRNAGPNLPAVRHRLDISPLPPQSPLEDHPHTAFDSRPTSPFPRRPSVGPGNRGVIGGRRHSDEEGKRNQQHGSTKRAGEPKSPKAYQKRPKGREIKKIGRIGGTHPNVSIRETRLGERLAQPKVAELHVVGFVQEDCVVGFRIRRSP
jgi:hypothetical protein